MKKYRNALVILVVVFLMLLAGYYFLTKDKSTDSQKPDADNRVSLLTFNEKDLTRFDITTSHGKFVFSLKNNQWLMDEPKTFKLDSSKVQSIVVGLSALKGEKLIEENAKDLSIYGLDKPIVVNLPLKNGTKVLEVGNKSGSGEYYYAKLKDSNKVYTINSSLGDAVQCKKDDLADKNVFNKDSAKIKEISLIRKGNKIFDVQTSDGTNWSVKYPIDTEADLGKTSEMVQSIASVQIQNFVEDNAKDLSKYGLDKPSYQVDVTDDKGKTSILIGDVKKKGEEVYAKTADSNSVFTIPDPSFNFLDRDAFEVVYKLVDVISYSDVSNVTLDYNGKTVKADITADKNDNSKDRFVVNGKSVSADTYSPFRNYYQSLVGIQASGMDINAKPTGKAEVTITFTMSKDGKKEVIKLIPKDSNTYYIVKDDKYTGLIGDKSNITGTDGIATKLKKLEDSMK